MNLRICKDGYMYAELTREETMALMACKNVKTDIDKLYDDGSTAEIEGDEDYVEHLRNGGTFGCGLGWVNKEFINNCPECPKCGQYLVPSTSEGYMWQCPDCDEDFTSEEIL